VLRLALRTIESFILRIAAMFLYLVCLNVYSRLFIFSLHPDNIWHWRLPAQGLLNELVAAGVFYLVFKILWFVIPFIRLRQIVFLTVVIPWIAINYVNFEYARIFNMLLPLSWFREIGNAGAMDGGGDVVRGLLQWEFLLLMIVPVLISLSMSLRKHSSFFENPRFRSLIGVFLLGSMAQSATLSPDIQTRLDSIIQSHLLKYWYYDHQRAPFPRLRTEPLPVFSDEFHRIILAPAARDDAVLPPLNQPRPNLVLIILESFRADEIGAFGSRLGITPNFDRYAEQGRLFTNIYATGILTKHGIWSTLCGSHKHNGDPVLTSYPDHASRCLSDVLSESGYDNWWFHGQSAAYDAQGYFLQRHGVRHIMDRLTFPKGARVMGWGLADEDLVDHALNHVDKAIEPFFWIIQSQTNHHPYEVLDAFQTHTVYSAAMNNLFNGIHYTDNCLGRFLDRFLETPQGQNSLILITADHGLGVPLADPDRRSEKRELLFYNIPLLVLYPAGQAVEPGRIETLGSQTDIMPTVLDLLEIEFDFPVFGRSLSRSYQHRFAKGQIGRNWLITEERVYYGDPPETVLTRSGEPVAATDIDRRWFSLIREIDDVQDWIIHQKDPVQTAAQLRLNGWQR
jgi:glucan phosphoethanolaminetransferase (alkaline phosphatase superfamily)